MLVDPVRRPSTGAADLARDRLDRAALGELGFEPVAIHDDTNTSSCAGRNFWLTAGGGGSRRAPSGARRRGLRCALAPVAGGGDLAVEAVEVELEGLELELGGGGLELAGADDDASATSRASSSPSPGGRRPGARGGRAGARRRGGSRGGEDGVEVGGGEPLLALLGQRDAVGEEALARAARRRSTAWAGSVGGPSRRRPPTASAGDAHGGAGRGPVAHGALDEIRRDAEPARRQLDEARRAGCLVGSGSMTARDLRRAPRRAAPCRSSARSTAKRANGTARRAARASRSAPPPPPRCRPGRRPAAAARCGTRRGVARSSRGAAPSPRPAPGPPRRRPGTAAPSAPGAGARSPAARVSAVPIAPTALAKPAWWSAITSV